MKNNENLCLFVYFCCIAQKGGLPTKHHTWDVYSSYFTDQARDVTGTHTKCATTGNILIFNILRHCNDGKTILGSSSFAAGLLR